MKNQKTDNFVSKELFLTQARAVLEKCIADIAAIESATTTIGCVFSQIFLDSELKSTLAKIDVALAVKPDKA